MVAMATSNRLPVGSIRSIKTPASSVSTAHAWAEAEAAKVRASYASQEAKLKLELLEKQRGPLEKLKINLKLK